MTSNITITPPQRTAGTALDTKTCSIGSYFEGTNVIVYIRGTDDPDGEWWKADIETQKKAIGRGGVLVNSHYDS